MTKPVALEGDKVVGVDTHIVMIPSPGGPVPTPIPHPFSGTLNESLSTTVKIENTRRLGGEVIPYDRWTEDREAICARVAAERGAVVVPSFDDAGVIAGQGTVGLEMAADAKALGVYDAFERGAYQLVNAER